MSTGTNEPNADKMASLKRSIEAQLRGSSKPIALVLTADRDEGGLFREDRGYYKANKQELINAGYQIIEISNIDDPKMLASISDVFSQSSIGMLLIRAHGHPKAMEFSKNCLVKSEEISTTFYWIVEKMKPNAVIALDSCSTGSLQGNFFDNIQFSFAKLTIDLPEVKIAAPSKVAFVTKFTIEDGEFEFYSRSEPYSSENSSVIISSEIKSKLKHQTVQSLESEREAILSMLQKNRPAFHTVRVYEYYLHEASFSHTGGLMLAIQKEDLSAVKYLIENFHANPDLGLSDSEFTWSAIYCPLNAAIDKRNIEIIEYLLTKGANIFLNHNGITPLSYLIQSCKQVKNYSVDLALELLDIFEQYIKYLNQLDSGLLHGHEKELKEFREFQESVQLTKNTRSDSIVPNFASSTTRLHSQSEHQKSSKSNNALKSLKGKKGPP